MMIGVWKRNKIQSRDDQSKEPCRVGPRQTTTRRKQIQRHRNRTTIISLVVLVWLSTYGVLYETSRAPTTRRIVESQKTQFILPNNDKAVKNNTNFFSSTSCGIAWTAFVKQNQQRINHGSQVSSSPSLTVWTVSGGPEYRSFLDVLLKKWETLLGMKIIVIALDKETVSRSCELGYHAVFWDSPAASYSRVADAKFQVSAHLAAQGVNQLFVELDVFCRLSPLHLFQNKQYLLSPQNGNLPTSELRPELDLVLIGHSDVQTKINIGMYFVRGSPKTAMFFQTLTELLRPSLADQTYIRGLQNQTQTKQKLYFDQDVFQDCLMLSDLPVTYFALNDTNQSKDLLRVCAPDKDQGGKQQKNLLWAMVPNIYISSYRPPAVYDSTYCIHPLANMPLSSFRTKLATAKFLGFDPVSAAADTRPMIKTVSGDMVFSEMWDAGFFDYKFTDQVKQRYNFQYPIALLVALAWKSNRVLVLPRYIRSKDTLSYPIFSLVSTASIEQWVPWRFLTPQEASSFEEENATVMVEMPLTTGLLDSKALDSVANNCNKKPSQVCAIHGLYRSSYPQSLESTPDTIIQRIVQNLTWCLDVPKRSRSPVGGFRFELGSGHYEHPCEMNNS